MHADPSLHCTSHSWGVVNEPTTGKAYVGCTKCGEDRPRNPPLEGEAFKPGHCPSCKHPQHVGRVCAHEVGTTIEDDCAVPYRCSCPPERAIKADGGKQRNFHLFAWDALPEIIQIYEYGIAKGYLPDSWRNVPPEQYGDALVRHVVDLLRATQVVDGKLVVDFQHKDPESGKRTLAHLAWNCVTLLALTRDPK